MNKIILFKIIGLMFLISGVFFLVWAAKVGVSKAHIQFGLAALILSICTFYLSFRYKKREGLSTPMASQSTENIPIIVTMATDNTQVIIPDTCPHCKNPNTNRSTNCEWCGNQIA